MNNDSCFWFLLAILWLSIVAGMNLDKNNEPQDVPEIKNVQRLTESSNPKIEETINIVYQIGFESIYTGTDQTLMMSEGSTSYKFNRSSFGTGYNGLPILDWTGPSYVLHFTSYYGEKCVLYIPTTKFSEISLLEIKGVVNLIFMIAEIRKQNENQIFVRAIPATRKQINL